MKVIKRDKINRPNQTCCYCNKSSTMRGILFPFSLLHRVKKKFKEVSFLCMKNSAEMSTHILRDISQEFFANFCATLCRHILHSYKLCKLETNVKKIRRTVHIVSKIELIKEWVAKSQPSFFENLAYIPGPYLTKPLK